MHPLKNTPNGTDRLRIDKWLWAARFFKTRGLATQAIDGGHVKLNGLRCKPSSQIRPGDRIELKKHESTFELTVMALSSKRGPASEAQQLYEEHPESIARRERGAQERRLAGRVELKGERPTKRERRKMDRWRPQDIE